MRAPRNRQPTLPALPCLPCAPVGGPAQSLLPSDPWRGSLWLKDPSTTQARPCLLPAGLMAPPRALCTLGQGVAPPSAGTDRQEQGAHQPRLGVRHSILTPTPDAAPSISTAHTGKLRTSGTARRLLPTVPPGLWPIRARTWGPGCSSQPQNSPPALRSPRLTSPRSGYGPVTNQADEL